MSNIEQVIDQVRTFSGADFVFVLSRRARLVTRGAPRDMPEVGRIRLVAAAEPLIGTSAIGEVTMAREELVPFGGAAPVDVYVAVAAEKAIICVVMSTWAAKIRVAPAIKAGVRALLPLLDGRSPQSARRRKDAEAPPASRPPASRPPVSRPPASKPPASKPPVSRALASKPPASKPPDAQWAKRTGSGLLNVSGPTTHASPVLERPPEIKSAPPPPLRGGSMPVITLGEAPLGRESLAAIEQELAAATRPPSASLPAITVGEATLGRESLAAIEQEMSGEARRLAASLPAITVEETTLGRESLALVEKDARPPQTSIPDNIRITLVSAAELPPPSSRKPDSKRMTQPWVESPADAKRHADAARLGRKLAPPKVTLKLEEVDGSLIDSDPAPHVASAPPRLAPNEPRAGKRRR